MKVQWADEELRVEAIGRGMTGARSAADPKERLFPLSPSTKLFQAFLDVLAGTYLNREQAVMGKSLPLAFWQDTFPH